MAIASKIRALLTRLTPRFNSLASRLIAAAAVWTVIGLAVGGLILSGIFRSTAEGNFDAQLKFDLDGMIAAAEPDDSGMVSLIGRYTDPRFERIYSGWYWQIIPANDPSLSQRSRSLWDKAIHIEDVHRQGDLVWGSAAGPDNQHLRVLMRRIEFPIRSTSNPTDMRPYDFYVAGDRSEIEGQIAQFNGIIIWSFLILGAGLIVAILLQVRVGLQPLRNVSEALARIRDGKARRLEGEFPAEIAPLAAELNSLIDHSAEVVGRARTHVSNLAHFLKTPLTVLAGEAAAHPGPLSDQVARQVGIMRRQVDHYLVRARAAGALDVLGNRTAIAQPLEDLVRVLTKIHGARAITVTLDCPSDLSFKGDRQDFEEMAGNLIDNACKWAKTRVAVSAARAGTQILLRIEDDGPGLVPEDRTRVMERGERLDESVPGSGLGLAIVRDIAKLYGGRLTLAAAALGGLAAELCLPSAG